MFGLKRTISSILIGAFLIVPAVAAGTGTVTGSYVNVRSGPDTTYSIIGGCASGTNVSILGESGNWYNVSVNGLSGYMSKTYVSAVTGVPGRVTGTVVNIRSGAGTSYSRIGTVVKGDSVQILETLSGWYKISAGGLTGYISSAYVEAEQTPSSGQTGKVTGSVVNLRSGPGTTYGVVGKAVSGDVLTILGKTDGWYKVSYQGSEAYITGDYFVAAGSVGSDAGNASGGTSDYSSVTGKGTVTGAVVNLRAGPGTNYSIVGQVLRERVFDVYGETNGWYVVDFNGTKAYISATYLSVASVTKTGTVTGSVVNLRSGAGTSYSIVAQLKNGDSVTVLGQSGDWYQVKTSNSATGYVSTAYVSVSGGDSSETAPSYTVTAMDKAGTVVGSYTNVRKYPTTSSDVVATLLKGTALTITGYVDSGWYQIKYNNITGFMSSDYVVAGDSSAGSQKSLGEQICEYAMQFIGVPYVYGGSSPTTGFDCSGLTQYVYKHFGYNINRISQYTEGVRVEKANLKPGDLVFFNTQGSGISHVGMYIGDGQFIHAPSPGKTVCVTRLDSDFYSTRFVCAVRIISE